MYKALDRISYLGGLIWGLMMAAGLICIVAVLISNHFESKKQDKEVERFFNDSERIN